MEPAIWTGMYERLPLEDAIAILHSHGWTCFESSFEHLVIIDGSDDTEGAITRVLEAVNALGVRIPQAHAMLSANVAGSDPDKRETDIQTIIRHIRISAAIGARTVVVHPGNGPASSMDDRAALFRRNADAFKRLAECAGGLGLGIGIENMHDAANRPGMRAFGAYPNELLDIVEAVGLDNVGVIIDTDHTSRQGLDPAAFIREVGGKLLGTHLSDCDGTGSVSHRTPGNGTVDWPGVMGALRDIGYDGVLNLEIPGERHADLGLRELKSRHALAVMGLFMERMG